MSEINSKENIKVSYSGILWYGREDQLKIDSSKVNDFMVKYRKYIALIENNEHAKRFIKNTKHIAIIALIIKAILIGITTTGFAYYYKTALAEVETFRLLINMSNFIKYSLFFSAAVAVYM